MSILLSENKPFSFLTLMVQGLNRLRACFPFVQSGIPDAPWITNRTRRRAYRATVVQVGHRDFQVCITERRGSYSREYHFRKLCTSFENRTFRSAKAAYRAGFKLTQQLALARYAWCR
ncbi:hypothetical protein [Providencia rettgeri]|uniref:hypothetical protein n=1 Tax=Providencia rettgeri TaxID=587 RepID=UPI0024ABD16A